MIDGDADVLSQKAESRQTARFARAHFPCAAHSAPCEQLGLLVLELGLG
jgi:hypothetical protein